MQTLFQVIALYGLFFFAVQRRVFDFVSAGFVGQLIYFMPGFYGYVANPYYTWIDPSIPISPFVYGIWSFALGVTILTGFLYRPTNETGWRPIQTSSSFDFVLIAVIILSFAGELYFSRGAFLSADKFEVLEGATRFSLLFSAATQIGLIAFILQKKYVRLIVPVLGCIVLLYAGFRSDLALAVVAIATFTARRQNIWSFAKPRYLVPLMGLVLLLFSYKGFLVSYRAGRWDLFFQYWDSDFVQVSLLRSEPFITQSILNEVVSRDLTMPATSVLFSLLAAIPFFVPLVGLENAQVAFSFQDQLFPNLSYGMASNIYANFYATLGIFGILLFVLMHNLALVGVSKALSSRLNSALRLGLVAVGAFLAFYIHRNDIANSLSIINRIVIALVVVWFLGRYIDWPLRAQAAPRARQAARS